MALAPSPFGLTMCTRRLPGPIGRLMHGSATAAEVPGSSAPLRGRDRESPDPNHPLLRTVTLASRIDWLSLRSRATGQDRLLLNLGSTDSSTTFPSGRPRPGVEPVAPPGTVR